MVKKRKRTSASIAAFVHHLDPSSSLSISSPHHQEDGSSSQPDPRQHQLNLSAYHPHMDPIDASCAEYRSLLPHCLVHPGAFASNMRKYWRHRFTLFSLYSAGCLLDEQSWYSVTPESVAFRIAKRCATAGVVVDLFAGAGGNAIQFASTSANVIAVECDPIKLRLAQWNAKVYGVAHNIRFIHGDSLEFLDSIQQWREGTRPNSANDDREEEEEVWKGITSADLALVDAVFLSPPWGGVDYAQPSSPSTTSNSSLGGSAPAYSLSSILPLDGTTLFTRVSTAFRTPNIAYYLPRNTALAQLSHLSTLLSPINSDLTPQLKVEYQYVNYGTKLSSLTAYYGALATEWDDQTDDWRTPS